MKRYGRSGWFNESYRHYLSAKGIKTKSYLKKLKDSDKVTLWHGTRNKNAEKILKEGLKVSRGKNPRFSLDYGGYVHLAPGIATAVGHAKSGPERMSGEEAGNEPVVLKVTIPKEYVVQKPKYGVDDSEVKNFPELTREQKEEWCVENMPKEFWDLPEEQRDSVINEVCVPFNMNWLKDRSVFHTSYNPTVDDSERFFKQYELVTERDIPPSMIKKINFNKIQNKGLRQMRKKGDWSDE